MFPRCRPPFHEARGNIVNVEQAMGPLILSISLAAVVFLMDEELTAFIRGEVRVNFHAERDDLLVRYRRGTEEALAWTDFINTTQLPVIQAFTHYLFVTRSTESTRYIWSMTGLLIRIAVCQHRLPSGLVSPSRNIHLRRRDEAPTLVDGVPP
ncbi:hypothetical protein A1O3_04639 [Capronia epimyces CBS 606.96]|uniref:Uncharacterized protein n=1 Tax=Capronia epimyces CBS 606.96 TaxID=1182542 RepID=W9XTV3_9EURO|nr:uncharacterized protein A1O3_04639 [Capronia epimyces CBS 606.96]EXJ83972.1 hypothetical protein A1O3_04639 [Capronia epimyces CBS 606.96]